MADADINTYLMMMVEHDASDMILTGSQHG